MNDVRRATLDDAQIEVREDGPRPTIRGCAARFNTPSRDLGGFREVVRPGAFDASLKEIAAGRRDVVAHVQHVKGLQTIGRTSNGKLRLWADTVGLWYEVEPPNTSAGRDIVELTRRRDIKHSSFSFKVRRKGEAIDWGQTPVLRELRALDLLDIAPCDDAAYEQSTAEARAMGADNLARLRARQANTADAVAPRWYEVRSNEEQDSAELWLYGAIGGWNIDAAGFLDQWRQIRQKAQLDIHIHTPGGAIHDAFAIYGLLKMFTGIVHVYVDGIALSAGSYVAMAGDRVFVSPQSLLMIHDPMTVAAGGPDAMRKAAEVLDKYKTSMINAYAAKSGKPEDEIAAIMADETWYTAQETLDAGFADAIVPDAAINAELAEAVDDMDVGETAKPVPDEYVEALANHGVGVRGVDRETAARDAENTAAQKIAGELAQERAEIRADLGRHMPAL